MLLGMLIVGSYLILVMNLALALFITVSYSGAFGGILLGAGFYASWKFTKFLV